MACFLPFLRRPGLPALLLIGLLGWGGERVRAASPEKPPRLVVVVSIDQFRADFLTRFQDLYAPAVQSGADGGKVLGGFEYLKSRGAHFADARHDHFPLFTGPGHAVQLTGAQPYQSGIIGNTWYDRLELGKKRYCVEDPGAAGKLIGTLASTNAETGISPASLQVSTVGDELRIATGGRAKVWGIALKDRAAILMTGHLANGVIWFDEPSGNWISSRYYFPSWELPAWVNKLNQREAPPKERFLDTLTNQVWTFGFPQAADRVWTGEKQFSHPAGGTNYKDFTFTPFANDYVFHTARAIIENEGLGADEVPDILAINLSSNDYVGHRHGPDSAEVLDISVRTDRLLGEFFTWLDRRIGLDQVLLVVTSDHGASPYPVQMRAEAHFDGERGNDRTIESVLNKELEARYGFKPGRTNAATLVEYNVYLHLDALQGSPNAADVHQHVADFMVGGKFGFYAGYTRAQILSGQLPRTDIADRVSKGFYPERSGDVVLVPKPYWVHLDLSKYPYRTSHGSPYAYDTSVPLLLAGPGVKPVRWTGRVSTLDLAPTLSHILGVLPPSGNEGRILSPAVD